MSYLEKEVMHGIRVRLEVWQMTGEVIWFSRLNSGKIRAGGLRWIQLCIAGTPDYLALVRGRNNEVIALFIEAKSLTGKLSPSQVDFQEKYHNGKDIYVVQINNPKSLDKLISEISINTIKEWNI